MLIQVISARACECYSCGVHHMARSLTLLLTHDCNRCQGIPELTVLPHYSQADVGNIIIPELIYEVSIYKNIMV